MEMQKKGEFIGLSVINWLYYYCDEVVEMDVQKQYDKVIKTIEDIVESRPHDYFEAMPSPDELSKDVLEAGGYYIPDRKARNSIFNFMTGMTFKQYFDLRVDMYAYKVMLEQDEFDPTVLMNIVGVETSSALYRRFQSTFNLTPSQAYEQKDPTKYVPPAYWSSLSMDRQEDLEKLLEENETLRQSEKEAKEAAKTAKDAEEKAWISEQIAKEKARRSSLAYKELRIGILLVIAAIAIFMGCFIRNRWAGEYIAFNLVSDEDTSIAKLDRDNTYTIRPFRNQLVVTSTKTQNTEKVLKLKITRKSVEWTDPGSKIYYEGSLLNDGSIIFYEYIEGQKQKDQFRLVRAESFEDWKAVWDGYYEVFMDSDGYATQNGYSVQIHLDASVFILSEILGDDTQIGWITYCGPDHLIISIPSHSETLLQANLTGTDTFTVTNLNSDDVLFKCYRVLQ